MDEFLLVLFNRTLTHPLLDGLMLAVTLGAIGVLPAWGVACVAVGKRRLGAAILFALGVALVLAVTFQYLALRPRPADVRLIWPQPNFPSYPSGHAAAAFAVALVTGLWFKRGWVWTAALILAALTAFSRVYLGFHYPSDILAGSVFGAALGAAGYGLIAAGERFQSRWRWLLWPQIAVMLMMTQMAYLGFLPLYLLRWPFADKVLHFLFFGAVVFWLNLWLNGRKIWRINWPLALVIPFSVAVVEEGFQLLSPLRTADWGDLACDLAGMLLFLWISYWVLRRIPGEPVPI